MIARRVGFLALLALGAALCLDAAWADGINGTVNGAVGLWANNVEALHITPTDMVGIGTTSPQSLLHAYGGEVQVGSSGASCGSANAGAMRYASGTMYYCNGSAWSPFSSSCSGSTSGTDTSLASGLVAYWNFNEGSGNLVDDATGNGNIGVWQGTLGSQWTTGLNGDAGKFDGSTNYVLVPASPSISFTTSSNFTISAWVYTTSAPSLKGIVSGFCGGGQGPFLRTESGKLDCGGQTFISFSYTFPLNQWVHVACTSSAGSATLYANGVSLGTGSITMNQGFGTTIGIGDDYCYIPANGRFWSGKIDEVAMWNVALTGTQISTLYNSGAGNALGAMVCPPVINDSGGFTN